MSWYGPDWWEKTQKKTLSDVLRELLFWLLLDGRKNIDRATDIIYVLRRNHCAPRATDTHNHAQYTHICIDTQSEA